MFNVHLEDKTLTVKFRHTQSLLTYQGQAPTQGITECNIFDGDDVAYWGKAFCSIGDHFDRRVGRKVAFARAISPLNKQQRSAFWNAYKEVCHV